MSLWRNWVKNFKVMLKSTSSPPEKKPHPQYAARSSEQSKNLEQKPLAPLDVVDRRKQELLLSIYKIMSDKRGHQHGRRATDQLKPESMPQPTSSSPLKKPKKPS